jgi:hypothetical protein
VAISNVLLHHNSFLSLFFDSVTLSANNQRQYWNVKPGRHVLSSDTSSPMAKVLLYTYMLTCMIQDRICSTLTDCLLLFIVHTLLLVATWSGRQCLMSKPRAFISLQLDCSISFKPDWSISSKLSIDCLLTLYCISIDYLLSVR